MFFLTKDTKNKQKRKEFIAAQGISKLAVAERAAESTEGRQTVLSSGHMITKSMEGLPDNISDTEFARGRLQAAFDRALTMKEEERGFPTYCFPSLYFLQFNL